MPKAGYCFCPIQGQCHAISLPLLLQRTGLKKKKEGGVGGGAAAAQFKNMAAAATIDFYKT